MLRNLVRELVEHGAIVTTKPKAKEVKRLADKVIYKAQQNTVAARRVLHRFFGKRDVVNTLVDRVAPVMTDRSSGFTTLAEAGTRRGDNTELFKLELVAKPEKVGSLKSGQTHKQQKTVKKASAQKKAAKPVSKTTKAAPVKSTKKAASTTKESSKKKTAAK